MLSDISDAVGLPSGFVTGTTELKADFGGVIRRVEQPYDGVFGTVGFSARNGEIRQKVPMIVALATATDGFNPFSSMSAMQYETITGELKIRDGRLNADRIELEGPVRVYASGSLEFGDSSYDLDGIVGVFLFQRTRELIGKIPLVNLVMPGSDKGMVGAYCALEGSWSEPEVSAMTLKSLQEQLPDIITKPFELCRSLLTSKETSREAKSEPRTEPKTAPQPDPTAAAASGT
jgi:hypothetical protein